MSETCLETDLRCGPQARAGPLEPQTDDARRRPFARLNGGAPALQEGGSPLQTKCGTLSEPLPPRESAWEADDPAAQGPRRWARSIGLRRLLQRNQSSGANLHYGTRLAHRKPMSSNLASGPSLFREDTRRLRVNDHQ